MMKQHKTKSGKTCLCSNQGTSKKVEWFYKYVHETYEIYKERKISLYI